MSQTVEQSVTPLPVIANISRVVTAVVDRITGDRVHFPLLVAAACVEALKQHGIQSQLMYGKAAWIEILEDHTLIWAGSWGDVPHFWATTQYGETVDLNTSIAFRARANTHPELKAAFSPPMLWSSEVPQFYRYLPEGVAELELTHEQDQKKYIQVMEEVLQKCGTQCLEQDCEEIDFPNESILCSGRKVLDDSKESFKHFDRVLSVCGIPRAPVEF